MAQLLGNGLSCPSGAQCCSGPEGCQGAEGAGAPARLETHTVTQAWHGTSEPTTLQAWKLLDTLCTSSTTAHFSGLQWWVFPRGRGGCGHAPPQRAGSSQRSSKVDPSDLLWGSPLVSGLPYGTGVQHLSPLGEWEAAGSCLPCRAHSTMRPRGDRASGRARSSPGSTPGLGPETSLSPTESSATKGCSLCGWGAWGLTQDPPSNLAHGLGHPSGTTAGDWTGAWGNTDLPKSLHPPCSHPCLGEGAHCS